MTVLNAMFIFNYKPQLSNVVMSLPPVLLPPSLISLFCLLQYGDFVDNLRVYVRGGGGGMGLPRLGGKGGDGGDVWVVATKNMTLKRIKDKYPEKRFVAGAGANSRFVFATVIVSDVS